MTETNPTTDKLKATIESQKKQMRALRDRLRKMAARLAAKAANGFKQKAPKQTLNLGKNSNAVQKTAIKKALIKPDKSQIKLNRIQAERNDNKQLKAFLKDDAVTS